MTIEELLDCSVEKLEAMSDQQIEDYFAPFFNVTRPQKQLISNQPKLLTTEDVSTELRKRTLKHKKGVLTPEAQAKFDRIAKLLEAQNKPKDKGENEK